jgi:uncharacterized DUF497 family protein
MLDAVIHPYYTSGVGVDWSKAAEHIQTKHKITPEQANEALEDPNAIIFDPDYNTKSGEQIRTVGYSPSKQAVLTVMTVEDKGTVYGASAWKSNGRDRRYYKQEGPDE